MANEKILVVDDDTNICELLRLYLTKEGCLLYTSALVPLRMVQARHSFLPSVRKEMRPSRS